MGVRVARSSVNEPVASDDSVSEDVALAHAEVSAIMSHVLAVLLESSLVEQQVDALSGGQLVLSVLLLYALGSSSEQSLLLQSGESLSVIDTKTRTRISEQRLLESFHIMYY